MVCISCTRVLFGTKLHCYFVFILGTDKSDKSNKWHRSHDGHKYYFFTESVYISAVRHTSELSLELTVV